MKFKRLAYPYIVWLVIFIVVPLVFIAKYSVDYGGESFLFSMEHYKRFFNPTYLRVLWKSLKMAVNSTVLCLLIGYPFAYFLTKFKLKVRNTLILLVVIPMWMNFLLRTYSWISILSKNGIINSILSFFGLPTINIMYSEISILLGMVYNFLPFMILPIYTTLIKIDKDYIEASHDLGADRIKTFTKLVFPMSLPGVITGITMVFIPAISTFEIAALLGGNKENLIGNIIEQQFRVTGNWNFGSSMSMVLLIMILLSLFVMNKFDPEYDKEVEKNGK
ncbi:MAG: ABC transporter permease [Peptoniphilaceae bacterium]|uniref:ABC transporter permease n=1 Tax=Parvimonas sp. TaxID=1944660 RepID=UPI0025F50940|nr:ABC transporter permease [Parvimonas sp.]MCI5997276.1 ABC transporter permease [Parvimonas sp.]MDD7765450.1 ABC transporter permease [Peptoniphilaceae bacterium]MDY3050991.1 ABC transporter permease [Parvimonas sp.]